MNVNDQVASLAPIACLACGACFSAAVTPSMHGANFCSGCQPGVDELMAQIEAEERVRCALCRHPYTDGNPEMAPGVCLSCGEEHDRRLLAVAA